MSEHSDLPENIRKAIEDILKMLSGMSPDEIFAMISEILEENGIEEFTELIESQGDFQIRFDQEDTEMGDFLDDLDDIFYAYDFGNEDIEPYYEICHIDGMYGEIIVEMPGLNDDSLIDWYDYEHEIFIHTVNTVDNYKVSIPLPDYYIIQEDNIIYRNGLLIIPFDIE